MIFSTQERTLTSDSLAANEMLEDSPVGGGPYRFGISEITFV